MSPDDDSAASDFTTGAVFSVRARWLSWHYGRFATRAVDDKSIVITSDGTKLVKIRIRRMRNSTSKFVRMRMRMSLYRLRKQ